MYIYVTKDWGKGEVGYYEASLDTHRDKKHIYAYVENCSKFDGMRVFGFSKLRVEKIPDP